MESQVHDFPVMIPSVCFICEGIEPGTRVFDTLRTFSPGGYTPLNGRKYLCENCVRDAALALDIYSTEREKYEAEIAEVNATNVELEAHATIAQTAALLADKLAPFIPKQQKAAPKRTGRIVHGDATEDA
jgi:hypothetical protein